mmetsp:Transcript_1098/g.1366  ORF Transcript_1098/g.1366 Transcript_1098/m.1366 type:complete len:105 (-) Transcript_1098:407-721(-)
MQTEQEGSSGGSMWEKFKAGAQTAATSAQVAAEKAKLQAEIAMLQNKVKSTKKEMGVAIYDAMLAADQAEVSRVFGSFKVTVDDYESQISAKRGRIDVLEYQQR